jgi:CRISPR-associated protein Cmr2
MKKFIFVFTLSPVQSFISQARKTKDLFAGSLLISKLLNRAVEIVKENRGDIIYPFVSDENPNSQSLPNRFVALVEGKDNDKIQTLGESVEKGVKVLFKEISVETAEKNKSLINNANDYFKQIDTFLEIYWTALEIDNSDYGKVYNEAEKQLASIKNYRPFDQLIEEGKKCSLCGQRNSVVKAAGDLPKEYSFALNYGEGLCLVCFTKRFYTSASYPATAQIALADTIDNIEKDIKNGALIFLTNYKKIFGEQFDYQLLYESNLNENYFRTQGLKSFINRLGKIREEYKKLYNAAKSINLQFTPYYALVMLDADSMGEWVSGRKINSSADLFDFQKRLSKGLYEFANSIKLSLPKGETVYAGGDDFLGFFNLNFLFDELNNIYNNFDRIVNSEVKEYLSDNQKITLSGGIIIAHYKTPLGAVLQECRNLEKRAKDYDENKNAFAISVMKHSGEIQTSWFKWKNGEKFILSDFNELALLLRNKKVTNKFISALYDEFSKIMNVSNLQNQEMIITELKRLIKRAKAAREDEKSVERVINIAVDLFYGSRNNLNNFISSLQIIDFISKHLNGGKYEN